MTTAPIKSKDDIEAMKNYFLKKGSVRDYVMFVIGINTGMKLSTLIALQWQDVYNCNMNCFSANIDVSDKRSQKKTYVSLNENCKSALSMLFTAKNGEIQPSGYIFESKNGGHITRFRALQIIKNASQALGIEGNINCRSMKKTLCYNICKESTQPSLVMNLYRHTSPKTMEHYLDIRQDEKDEGCTYPNL